MPPAKKTRYDRSARSLADAHVSSRLTPQRVRWAAGLLLVAITVVAYVPAIRGGFIWDDDFYVTENRTLRSLDGLGRIWFEIGATPQYYPLVHTSYWIEYRLWGLNPAGYHAVNVLLHVAGALLAWRVLAALQVPGAWLAAAVFALHPVHVESVAWITERKNALSGVFYLAAALAYLRFALASGEPAPRPARARWYAAALVLFLWALLSKTVAGSLPAAVLLALWWKRGRIRWADLWPLVPFFALAVALGSLTALMEKHHVGALGNEWNFSVLDRGLIAGRALWFYAAKLLWPAHLTFIYPRWRIDAGQWSQYLYPAAAVAVVVALWLARHRLGPGPLAAILFFGGTLVPALGFFNVYPMRYSFVADHFQYLASLGLIALAAAVGSLAVARLGTRGRSLASALAGCVLMILGVLTWRQGYAYADLETLWRDTLRKNPDAWIANNNLGNVLQQQGRLDEAMVCFREAMRLKPDEAQVHNNLAGVLTSLDRLDEAIRHVRQALQLDPNYWEAHRNMGIVLARRGAMAEAVSHYERALLFRPDDPEVCNNLAWILATSPDAAVRREAEALRLAEHAAELTGHADPAVLDTLAAACASAGRFDRAVAVARKALARASGPRGGELAGAIRARLELYRQAQPYREPAATSPAAQPPSTNE